MGLLWWILRLSLQGLLWIRIRPWILLGISYKYLQISCHFYIPLWSFRTNNTAFSNTEIFIFFENLLKNCYEKTHIWTKIKFFDKGIRATSSVQLSVFDIQLLTIVILSETVKPK